MEQSSNSEPPTTVTEPHGNALDPEWRAMADAVSAALVYLSREREILRANRRACELMGDHCTWEALVQTEPWRTAAQLVDLVESSGVDDFMESRGSETSQVWEISVARWQRPLADGGMVLVLRDVSERVLLEDKLRRKERLMALGNLVDGISHQIRSNLFGLTGLVDVISSHLDDGSNLHTYLDLQRRQTGRIVNLLDRLTQFAGKSEPNRTPGELAPVIETAIAEGRRAHGTAAAEVILALDPATPPLVMDRDRLALALSHLVRNAFEHSPETGQITVRSRLANRDALEWIYLEIDDQGPGVRDEDRDHLFEPFFSRRPAGHGLGLPIARRIVEEHGGQIALGNNPGGGCRVTLSLPVFRRPGPGSTAEPAAADSNSEDGARTPK